MMQTVQLSITDALYAASLREALSRNCAWHVESVERPDPSRHGVMVVDQGTFERLPLPLSNPERIVLISRKEPGLLAEAWEAGIVSVVSPEDPINTALLAGHGGRPARRQTPCRPPITRAECHFPQRGNGSCVNSPRKPDFRTQTL